MTCLGIGCEHHVLPIPECGGLREAAEEAKESMGRCRCHQATTGSWGPCVRERWAWWQKLRQVLQMRWWQVTLSNWSLSASRSQRQRLGLPETEWSLRGSHAPRRTRSDAARASYSAKDAAPPRRPSCFPSAQAVCLECKRFLDRIYGQCQTPRRTGLVAQTACRPRFMSQSSKRSSKQSTRWHSRTEAG